MDNQTILKLVETYKGYENSTEFIYAAVESLSFKDSKNVKHFIENTFSQNQIEKIDYGVCRGLSSHWKNVAIDKLNMNDYKNYAYCMATSINLAIVSKFLQTNSKNL